MTARTAPYSPARIILTLLFLATFLAALNLAPAKVHAAQASLSWTPPTTYTDGTPLTNLGGFKIYEGTASGSYSQSIDVGDVTSYTLNNLSDGTTWYFAVTAYDTAGGASGFSNEVVRTFPAVYSITATAGTGGSLTPVGTAVNQATNGTSTVSTVSVVQGGSQSFSITPAAGYAIAGVTVDGGSVGAVSTYTFTNVSGNHTIAANFISTSVSSYSISATAGTGGSISPSGTTTVTSGTSQSFTITPASGYQISGVSVDGASVGAVATYTFSNVTANHTIQASFTATGGGSGSTAGNLVFAANAGGSAFAGSAGVNYLADTMYSGGNIGTTTATISGTTEGALYQKERYGNFSYNVPVANGNYSVTLKFAEIYWSAPGRRIFSVSINGQSVISNLDLYAKVGKNKAYDVVIPVSVTNGNISITFTSQVDNAKVSGIQITSSNAGKVVFADNSGGSQYTSSTGITYAADAKYSGGNVGTTTAAISGTSDGKVYQTERYGNFSYGVPVANGNYLVTLKMTEFYWAAAGKRVFSVAVNGKTVISSLDLYATAGKNRAFDLVIPVSVTNGAVNITFTRQVDNAKIDAIVVTGM